MGTTKMNPGISNSRLENKGTFVDDLKFISYLADHDNLVPIITDLSNFIYSVRGPRTPLL